jgi:endonuclease/exonuclease/phosphatase family metal-dependent hydrolase
MELCFISCNIRFDNPADGQNSWSHRKDFLAQILLNERPHIIATQEGRFAQLKDLESLLVDYELIDQHRSWIGERMYPTIFIKKNTFEFCKSGDLWLSETPEIAGSRSFESAFPRLMTWTKLQLKESAKNLFIVNTHLDHIKSETRVHQIKVLAHEIKRVWDQHTPLVIMGDFNDSPQSEVRSILISEFPSLVDAWILKNEAEETSHHGFKGLMDQGARIDWIMLDHKLSLTECYMNKKNLAGKYPTDHFPIICKINF